MANFKTHIVVGATVSGIISSTLLSTSHIDSTEAFALFTLGTLGSIAPDIDSKTSIPFKVSVSLISVFASFFIIFSKNNYSLLEMGILWFISFYAIRFLFTNIFTEFTSHRGIFHSIPMGFLFGIFITLLLEKFFWIDSKIATWSGFFVTLGFITHLILDEIYSVDLMNKRLKNSFGTAFTLYKKNNIYGTIALYFLIIVLFQNIQNYSIVIDTISSNSFYSEIFNNLYPHDTWFKNLIKFN